MPGRPPGKQGPLTPGRGTTVMPEVTGDVTPAETAAAEMAAAEMAAVAIDGAAEAAAPSRVQKVNSMPNRTRRGAP